jgi:hypothetical protein
VFPVTVGGSSNESEVGPVQRIVIPRMPLPAGAIPLSGSPSVTQRKASAEKDTGSTEFRQGPAKRMSKRELAFFGATVVRRNVTAATGN